ncbi:MAG: SMP-30/gluconolactonase/LRE family protein [Candidatus Latescibacterota bacterium]
MSEPSKIEVFADHLAHPEGVAIDRAGYVYTACDCGTIYRISPQHEVRLLTRTKGRGLGVTLNREGDLFVCDPELHAVLRISPEGKVSTFSDHADGHSLGAPNFAVFDLDGNLYVTNSGDALFRIRPNGRAERFAEGFSFSNGLAMSLDENVLFVAESNAHDVIRIEIRTDGTIGDRSVYVENLDRTPDGLALDALGNLYVTLHGSDRIIAVAPDGRTWTAAEDATGLLKNPSNCAFGGPDFDELYIANLGGTHIAKIFLGVRGQSLAHQLG